MSFVSIEHEVKDEIMKTDVFVKIFFEAGRDREAHTFLNEGFRMFRRFEQRFSRFRKDNELWELNEGTSVIVSPELLAMLERAKEMFVTSAGLFDPAVLPLLEQEGYPGAYGTGPTNFPRHTFAEVTLDPSKRHVQKPRSLKIDLGGIGKGFIVDQVSDFLSAKFEHFLVDAGGDIRVSGMDQGQDIEGWAIAIEDPREEKKSLGTLILRDCGIATSGINRRRWKQGMESKHHLIDPTIGTSSNSDLVSATVIAKSTLTADLLAKTLFLSGSKKAIEIANERSIPVILVTQEHVTINAYARTFMWST